MEQTLIIFKPSSVARGYVGNILTRFESEEAIEHPLERFAEIFCTYIGQHEAYSRD